MARNAATHRSSRAYEELRAGILSGRWGPDERLSTYRLADELGMSRTPIIEALKRLEADRLIEIVPQVGCRVLLGRPEEIDEAFVIRASLEGLAAELAAPRITAEQVAALRDLAEQTRTAVDARDVERYTAANRELHRLIVRASATSQLERILEDVWTLHRHHLAGSGFLERGMRDAPPEHHAIVDALEARDPAAARTATERHVRRCLDDYRAFAGDRA